MIVAGLSTLRDRPPALALERRFPTLVDRLARETFTELPTPVARLARLGHRVGIDQLYIKRDDLSGPLYGGNKPRKLEFVLGDARRRRRSTVLTFGGIGSHQALATTICAGAVGMRTQLVLVPQPVTDHVRHTLLLDHAHGAELHLASGMVHAATTTVTLIARDALAGTLPAIIPVGATSTLGTIGYVNAALELADQVRAGELPSPHTIFVALGSGGTIAGLVLGFKLAELRTRVVGVLVTDLLAPSTRRLARLARGALAYLRRRAPAIPDVTIGPDDFTIATDELGPGYGASTPAAEEARRLMAESEGITLETTYTAKCLAALLRFGKSAPSRGGNGRAGAVLFWNTFSAIEPAAPNGLPAPDELPPAFRKFFR